MVVCPLCEHAQAGGTECEVCGRRLPAGSPAEGAIPLLDGLEPTRAPAAGVPPPAAFPELEVTSHAPVGAARTDPVPGLEPTPASPVEVAVEPLLGVDRGLDGLPTDGPTPYPALVVCRYCRTEAALGERICARCGMRLPAVALVPPPPAAEESQMCSCGVPVRGPRCPACGARTPRA
jgi:hypothetical protein